MMILESLSQKVLVHLWVLLIAGLLTLCACETQPKTRSQIPGNNFWAWERPEDFSWLAGKDDGGVAYLAQTLVLKGDRLEYRPRLQPLKIPPGVFVTAVTRIETGRGTNAAAFSDHQINTAVRHVSKTASAKGVGAVQIDFDAARSERPSYTKLLGEVRKAVPGNKPLSITAIASWCTGDRWLGGLPVDDVVPMVFDMGSDDETIRRFLRKNKDWPEPLCRNSYGIAGYDPVSDGIRSERRFYFFSKRPWKHSDFYSLTGEN